MDISIYNSASSREKEQVLFLLISLNYQYYLFLEGGFEGGAGGFDGVHEWLHDVDSLRAGAVGALGIAGAVDLKGFGGPVGGVG